MKNSEVEDTLDSIRRLPICNRVSLALAFFDQAARRLEMMNYQIGNAMILDLTSVRQEIEQCNQLHSGCAEIIKSSTALQQIVAADRSGG